MQKKRKNTMDTTHNICRIFCSEFFKFEMFSNTNNKNNSSKVFKNDTAINEYVVQGVTKTMVETLN